jgi:IS4 transposase
MVFLTNNLSWSPRSVCDLYRRRWDIEVFFKQVKQSIKIGSFLGHSANVVRWQVYTALMLWDGCDFFVRIDSNRSSSLDGDQEKAVSKAAMMVSMGSVPTEIRMRFAGTPQSSDHSSSS